MRRKAPKKTKEEKLAESFFPVDESDLKYTIEKKIKKLDEKYIEKIETIGKKRIRKVTRKTKKVTNKNRTTTEFIPPNINLKENSYELIITEKPQAAMKIASALGNKGIDNSLDFFSRFIFIHRLLSNPIIICFCSRCISSLYGKPV